MGLDGDREAIRLANFLKQAFEKAGFKVDGVWEDSLIAGTGPGILIRQDKKEGVGSNPTLSVRSPDRCDATAHETELCDVASGVFGRGSFRLHRRYPSVQQ